MKALLSTYFDICLLKRGPELVPTHPLFFAILVGAYVIVGLMLGTQLGPELSALATATHIVVNMAAMAVLTWFALYLRDVVSRFPATISALLGCDLLLSALLLIVLQFTGVAEQLTQAAVVLVGVWSIAVSGYILHHALGVGLFLGILVALGILLVSFGMGELAAVRG